jgi:hypothetical protein
MDSIINERRRFLVGAMAFTGLAATGLGAQVLGISKAWANNPRDPSATAAMVRMARQLYPHDRIADDVYIEVLEQSINSVAGSGLAVGAGSDQGTGLLAMLQTAEDALNAQQSDDFVDLDEASQLAALKAIEHEGYFIAIQYKVKSFFYHHPAVWKIIGYEGPSWMKGGYLHRGAGEIHWLEEY